MSRHCDVNHGENGVRGRGKSVFPRSVYSELKCKDRLKFSSLDILFGSYLKMPTKNGNKSIIKML